MSDALMIVILKQVASAAGAKAGATLIRDVLRLKSAEMKLLESMNADVSSILHGPFQTGFLRVDAALAAHRAPDERERFLRKALDSFTEALGQEKEPIYRSLARFNLAVIWLMLDSRHDVPEELRLAHLEAARGMIIMRKGHRLRRPHLAIDHSVRDYMEHLAHTRTAWGSCFVGAPLFPNSRTCAYILSDQEDRFIAILERELVEFIMHSQPCQYRSATGDRCAIHVPPPATERLSVSPTGRIYAPRRLAGPRSWPASWPRPPVTDRFSWPSDVLGERLERMNAKAFRRETAQMTTSAPITKLRARDKQLIMLHVVAEGIWDLALGLIPWNIPHQTLDARNERRPAPPQ